MSLARHCMWMVAGSPRKFLGVLRKMRYGTHKLKVESLKVYKAGANFVSTFDLKTFVFQTNFYGSGRSYRTI